MRRSNITYYAGEEPDGAICTRSVYDDNVCQFLNTLSERLRKDAEAREYPDIRTFAFWCRKANIRKCKDEFLKRTEHTCRIYLGRGLFFHIAPSNVPINFAYTLAFGLLSGNANIVRVSEKEFPQVAIVCRILNDLFHTKEYVMLGRQNAVITYPHNKAYNDIYSQMCAGRIIWGGDATIRRLRESPLPCRGIEIAFADRYSFAVFQSEAVAALNEEQLHALAKRFYNDTYLIDQNACSSPHLILWKGSRMDGRDRFWEAVFQAAESYDFTEKKAVDKFLLLCEKAMVQTGMERVDRWTNLLMVVKLKQLPASIEQLRGRFGLFFEYQTDDLTAAFAKMDSRVQTCVYYGVDTKELTDALMQSHTAGTDRFVPVGKALDIGVYWDGFDVIGTMAREISY